MEGFCMLNAVDQEKLTKASQTADLLIQDLRDMVKSENLLLVEIVMDVLQQAALIEQKLKRLESISK